MQFEPQELVPRGLYREEGQRGGRKRRGIQASDTQRNPDTSFVPNKDALAPTENSSQREAQSAPQNDAENVRSRCPEAILRPSWRVC
jgi:hypothetical protein